MRLVAANYLKIERDYLKKIYENIFHEMIFFFNYEKVYGISVPY